ncbi:MAG: hypothetical protein EAZ12_05295 [Sphingobacteriia bacterium]|nr:MAG: hypothetical protein EAZ12_05295 [Sphingobacteriia bacterium]
MNKLVISFISIVLLIAACKSKSNKQIAKQQTIADTSKYYPIDNFIKDQMKFVDLRDFVIHRTITKDSSESNEIIDKSTFLAEAAKVLSITNEYIRHKELYKESVFQDLSTASYTINYTPTDPGLSIQRMDVLLSEETNIIKRCFIRTTSTENGLTTVQQISWLADHQFQISQSQTINGKTVEEKSVISWDKVLDK